MPEAVQMYITTILGALLLAIGGITAWLVQTVIKNQSRIVALEVAITHVVQQLAEIKAAIGSVDREVNDGFKEIHKRIDCLWREGGGPN